ncbi:MAG: PQQ-dependent sugar dehydrogenase [Saprospiraceae bacterium]
MRNIYGLLLFLIIPLSVQGQIKYTNFKSGLGTVTDISNAADGTNRIFVANKNGVITIVSGTAPYTTLGTLLDISSIISTNSEEGLLGLAFDPNFASNGFFFVNYVPSGTNNNQISRFTATTPSANTTVSISTQKLILTVRGAQFENHKGGDLTFGPDGYLYIPTGDGGNGGDPFGNGQNGDTLLAKILRIDVNTAGTYLIPPTNPFVSVAGIRDEVWDMGVRNPWRISFDRQTGDLWIADVGQGVREEINFESPGAGGKNYGWNCREGFAAYGGGCTNTPPDPAFTNPIFDYLHCSTCNAGTIGFGNSITGGFVYRGNVSSNAALNGYYVCADYVSHHAWIIKQTGSAGFRQALDVKTIGSLTSSGITSFGEMENGEILAGLENGNMGFIAATAALPVGLIRFNATTVSNSITLDWNTGSEINTLQYHIERSQDGQQFEELSKVSAKGKAADYQFIDTRPLNNHNYYRLKIEDLDGTFEYSSIVHQKMQVNHALAYYQKESREIKIDLEPMRSNERINLYTLQGTLVRQVSNQDTKINVDDLPSGIYFLSMPGSTDRLFQKILIY